MQRVLLIAVSVLPIALVAVVGVLVGPVVADWLGLSGPVGVVVILLASAVPAVVVPLLLRRRRRRAQAAERRP